MKINEIIAEGRDGKRPDHTDADTGEWKFRDLGGYDRAYNLNRVMMAAAMADGTGKPIDMDQSSWVDKFNLARPYTETEHEMMKQAFKTVDSDFEHSEPDHKSKELNDTYKKSPIAKRKKNQYGV